jgi:DNA-binding response OmpR family regulator
VQRRKTGKMNKRVLVVDDDYHLRKFISVNLEARGYSVAQAVDGIEAMSMFGSQDLDIIILDITMPRLDGFEVCKLVRKVSDIPIIMLSARQEVEDKARCFELGANEYMIKPFGLRELLARVEAVLRRARLNKDSLDTHTASGTVP